MVSDSCGCAANWLRDALRSPDHPGIINECQMSIFKAPHMILWLGLTRNQDGGEMPIGSH